MIGTQGRLDIIPLILCHRTIRGIIRHNLSPVVGALASTMPCAAENGVGAHDLDRHLPLATNAAGITLANAPAEAAIPRGKEAVVVCAVKAGILENGVIENTVGSEVVMRRQRPLSHLWFTIMAAAKNPVDSS